MNVQEACNLAIAGGKVRHDKMPAEAWMDYPTPFNGFYRNFNETDRCQFIFNDDDNEAEWYVLAEGWDSIPDVVAPEPEGWGSYE